MFDTVLYTEKERQLRNQFLQVSAREIKILGRPEAERINSEKLHQSMYRVCSDHFHSNSFSSMLMNRLKKDAFPSIFPAGIEGGRAFDKDLSSFLVFEMPLTNAEKCKNYRKRKKEAEQIEEYGSINKTNVRSCLNESYTNQVLPSDSPMAFRLSPQPVTTENGIDEPENADKSVSAEKSDVTKNNGIDADQNENSVADKKSEEQEESKEKESVENGIEKDNMSSEVPNRNGSSEPVSGANVNKDNGNKDNQIETGTNNEEHDDDDFDFNPLLLCPDISMDVDESPVVTTSSRNVRNQANSGADSIATELSDPNSLFEPLFSTFVDEMTGAEISFNLTAEEQQLRERMYGPNNPIEFSKVHCSACNVHLGSALAGQTNRFVHPLLKVLICKECYHFYMSGEFEKDEDGSELYCRWCGQGGQVLCCTKCEFVFCKKCIRINFGRKKLTEVRDSEEWLCFRCDISQLKELRAMCVEFFEYVKRETARAATVGDENYMNRDLTTCCQTQMKKRAGETTEVDKEVKRPKRKKIVEDPDYNPFSDYSETKPKIEEKEEIVPVAGPSGINNKNVTPKLPPLTPKPVMAVPKNLTNVITMPGPSPTPTLRIGNTIINVNPSKATPISNNTLRMLNANMRPIANTGTPRPNVVFAKARPTGPRPNIQGTTQRFALLPGTSKVLSNIRMSPAPQTQSSSPNAASPKETTHLAKTQPPMKHEWFEKTVRSAARVNSNLSYTLTQLNKAQANAASVEQLAVVHNKLQEILSSSINSLIQIRKNLRTEFIAGIKSIKFPSKPKNNTGNNNDDDDVVIVSSSTPEVLTTPKTKSKAMPVLAPKPSPAATTPTKVVRKTVVSKNTIPKNVTPTSVTLPSGGYLKVRSFSQLQTVPSECITIPDDEPPKRIKTMVESTDPLAVDPVDTDKRKDDTVATDTRLRDASVAENTVQVEDRPAVEEPPIVEDQPIVDDRPVAEDTSVVEDQPIVENTPVVDVPLKTNASVDKDAVTTDTPVKSKEKQKKKKHSTEKKNKTVEDNAEKKNKKKESRPEKQEDKTLEADNTNVEIETVNDPKTSEDKTKENDENTDEAHTDTNTEKRNEGESSAVDKEETIEARLSNGVPEGDEPVKVKEEPKDCDSFIITEKPSPKIRRMLSVKVNLKKTPIIENMVKKEPIENGG